MAFTHFNKDTGRRISKTVLGWESFARRNMPPGHGFPLVSLPATIGVYNATEEDIPQYGVVGLDSPIWTPTGDLTQFRADIVFKGVVPEFGTHENKLAIVLDPLPAGQTGIALINGAVQVRAYVTATTDTSVVIGENTVGDETVYLETASGGGIPLLWLDPEADAETIGWGIANLGAQSLALHWAKLDAALDYDDTTGVTASVWKGNPLADTGDDIKNVLPPATMTEGTIPGDAGGDCPFVLIGQIDGQWHVLYDPNAELPEGTTTNDMLRWNDTTGEWVIVSAPSTSGNFVLTVQSGTMQWEEYDEAAEFECPS